MPRTHSVYVMYGLIDGVQKVLYVGSTSRGMTRFHEHAIRSWWPLVRTTKWYHRASRQAALRTERRFIAELDPIFNDRKGDGS